MQPQPITTKSPPQTLGDIITSMTSELGRALSLHRPTEPIVTPQGGQVAVHVQTKEQYVSILAGIIIGVLLTLLVVALNQTPANAGTLHSSSATLYQIECPVSPDFPTSNI